MKVLYFLSLFSLSTYCLDFSCDKNGVATIGKKPFSMLSKTNKKHCVDCSIMSKFDLGTLGQELNDLVPNDETVRCLELKNKIPYTYNFKAWEVLKPKKCTRDDKSWQVLDSHLFMKKDKILRVRMDYPFNSVYSYVKGYQPRKNVKKIEPVALSELKRQIDLAVAANVDPFMAIALNQMENPFEMGVLNRHTHDGPAAKALGCRADKVGKKMHQHFQQWRQPHLLESLKQAYNDNSDRKRQVKLDKGKSYLCVGEYKTDRIFKDYIGSSITSEPHDGRYCCSMIPYEVQKTYARKPRHIPENHYNDFISHAVTFTKLRNMQNRKNPPEFLTRSVRTNKSKKDLPEFRLQDFLGYSLNTGTGMKIAVSPFRLGNNSTTHPNYGYQAMDFIVNTVARNPIINRLVDDARSRYKKNPPSILCLGKDEGQYSIDDEYYFNKHKNTPRFTYIKSKIASGASAFADIRPLRHTQPLVIELNSAKVLPRLAPKIKSLNFKLPTSKEEVAKLSSSDKNKLGIIVDLYFKEIYPGRSTIGDASKQDNPEVTWERFTPEELASANDLVKKEN